MQFARDMDHPLADKFVGMYVNEYTLECGERGQQAIERLLALGHQIGVLPNKVAVDLL